VSVKDAYEARNHGYGEQSDCDCSHLGNKKDRKTYLDTLLATQTTPSAPANRKAG